MLAPESGGLVHQNLQVMSEKRQYCTYETLTIGVLVVAVFFAVHSVIFG
ncbi:hypothetical protein ACVWYN_001050 [Pedobacter sp. UYP24]